MNDRDGNDGSHRSRTREILYILIVKMNMEKLFLNASFLGHINMVWKMFIFIFCVYLQYQFHPCYFAAIEALVKYLLFKVDYSRLRTGCRLLHRPYLRFLLFRSYSRSMTLSIQNPVGELSFVPQNIIEDKALGHAGLVWPSAFPSLTSFMSTSICCWSMCCLSSC